MVSLLLLLAIAFTGFTAMLLVGIGVVEAPWPILLTILLAGLGFTQWASQRSSLDQNRSAVASPASPMKARPNSVEQPTPLASPLVHPVGEQTGNEAIRVYRGIPYECAQAGPQNCDSHVLEGTYRGQHWQHDSVSQPQPLQPPLSIEIKYRGIRIRQAPSTSDPTDAEPPTPPHA